VSPGWLAFCWAAVSGAMAHGPRLSDGVIPAKSFAWMLNIVGYLSDGYALHFINPEEESINKLHAMQIFLLYF